MRFINTKALDAVASDTSTASNAIDASYMLYASAQVIVTGEATGTVKLQASNDKAPQYTTMPFVPTNWSDITDATVDISASGVLLIEKTDICYEWIRVVYTSTDGAAVGTITVNVKTIGA